MVPNNHADAKVAGAEHELDLVHRTLFENVRRLGDVLARVAARLESEGVEARVNSLGEVQGLALDIDRGCALLTASRASRDAIRAAVAHAREERR
jgi:hypothetical protein